MTSSITVATRRSTLALAQTRAFVRALIAKNPGLVVEELHVVTTGDRIQDRPLNEIGGKGLFVREIEEALLEGRADIAVHSMKDLPAGQPDGLVIACIPERADPRDVLLVRPGRVPTIDALPRDATVGSSSLRRKIKLESLRRDLRITPLRGNIDTRIRKLVAGEYDAIVLAAAGLGRLGVDVSTLPPHAAIDVAAMLPAVAQGTLAIEARVGDERVAAILAPMDHRVSRLRAAVERGVLKALGADCTVPLAAFAELADDTITVRAWLSEGQGGAEHEAHARERVVDEATARRLGARVGADLLAQRK